MGEQFTFTGEVGKYDEWRLRLARKLLGELGLDATVTVNGEELPRDRRIYFGPDLSISEQELAGVFRLVTGSNSIEYDDVAAHMFDDIDAHYRQHADGKCKCYLALVDDAGDAASYRAPESMVLDREERKQLGAHGPDEDEDFDEFLGFASALDDIHSFALSLRDRITSQVSDQA